MMRYTQFGAVDYTLFIKKLRKKLGVRPNFGGSGPPDPQWLRPWLNTRSLLCCLVIDLVPFLSYCFLIGSSLVTLCSCKTVHIEPRQLRMIFETLFLILQWKRRLATLQQSQNSIGTNSAHL